MSINIKNLPIEDAEEILLDKVNWGFTDYTPKVYAKIVYNESGFRIKFVVHESNPLRQKMHHFEEVSQDSCVEFFANFDPEHSDEYINFEVNAIGIMRADIRTDRYNYRNLSLEDIEGLDITTKIEKEVWSVSYNISENLIKKYYPHFSMNKCRYIKGNLYKCGSKTKIRHYLTLFELKCDRPDFHRPEYFGRINLV